MPGAGKLVLGLDYSSIEMLTLAAECQARYGYSRLGEVLKSGVDPHAFTAAMLLGISYDEFRTSLREEMLIERMRQRYIQSRVQVSETEIDQLLAQRAIGGPEVRLANIVVALPDGRVGYRYSFGFAPDGTVQMNGLSFGDLMNNAIPQ